MTPYAAPMLSRFITAALSGTTTERNTIASSSTETATTNAMTTQSRSLSMPAMSAKSAVAPVSSTPAGRSARSSSTRPLVRGSVGAKAGIASKTAMAPSGETVTGRDVG